jgi:hypothetical protein
MPLNLDLSELENLTLSDESTAVREQIRRARVYVQQQISARDNSVAIPAAAELARRMLNLIQILNELGDSEPQAERNVEIIVAQFEAEGKRLEAAENALQPDDLSGGDGPLPAQIFLRNEEVLQTMLEAIQRELNLLELITSAPPEAEASDDDDEQAASTNSGTNNDPGAIDIATLPDAVRASPSNQFRDEWERLVRSYQDLSERARNTPNVDKPIELPRLIDETEALLAEVDDLQVVLLAELERLGIDMTDSAEDQLKLAASVVEASNQEPFNAVSGLRPLEVNVDEAMLTALVQRLDLMNARGELADAWRQIKYAGDDLRSVLNIRATHSLRNRTFDDPLSALTPNFDSSETRLSLEFDAPLNRRIERNNFRLALIDYNVALRNLIGLEDEIKLDIRNDLRALELIQNQYEISIASAALAYERVISTRLQLAFGQGNITARDFLESQAAYTGSLIDVARLHVDYILGRIEFFLDLEQLQVDQLNFWPQLRDEDYPFIANTDFSGINPDAYGELPCGPWYSKRLLRMEQVPNGFAFSHREPEDESQLERAEFGEGPMTGGESAEDVPAAPAEGSEPDSSQESLQSLPLPPQRN